MDITPATEATATAEADTEDNKKDKKKSTHGDGMGAFLCDS